MMLQEMIPRSARLLFGSVLVGFGLAALLSLPSVRYTGDSGISMVATKGAVRSIGSMQAYSPFNGKKYETLSYLPVMNNEDIRQQIEFMMKNKWTPCLEISGDGDVYLNTAMGPGYYDNRYWSLYKLPMFGCTNAQEVINAIESCKSDFPQAKIRVIGFDSWKQVQTAGFIVKK
jgi:ribulose-bisphosphate carboxylase small chain